MHNGTGWSDVCRNKLILGGATRISNKKKTKKKKTGTIPVVLSLEYTFKYLI